MPPGGGDLDSTVRDHIPLEQGLRLNIPPPSLICRMKVRDHIPLEQGLRPPSPTIDQSILASQRPYSIRTRIKTNKELDATDRPWVRDHIPLEQGLRLFVGFKSEQ